jgi:benzoate-CoA ligase
VVKTAVECKNVGIQSGDFTTILMPDCIDNAVIFLGLLYIGAVPLVLSTNLSTPNLTDIIKFVGVKHVIVQDKFTHVFPSVTTVTVSQLKNLTDEKVSIDPVFVHPDSPGYLGLSSGTTGVPKIAVHRHQAFFEVAKIMPLSYNMTQDSILMSTPKMSWGFGLHNSITSVLSCGATGILISDIPAPSIIFDYALAYEPTIISTSPVILKKILSNKKKNSFPANLKTVVSGSEDLPRWVYEDFLKTYGIKIDTAIGQLEVANVNYAGTIKDHAPGTVGKPFPGVEVEIRSSNGTICREHQTGEIYVKSQCNVFYYYNNYLKTKETFIGEWVKTGDHAYWDSNQNIVFVGRTNDVFKVGDLLVSPIEVESVLETYQSVKQVAVAGVDNYKGNKELHAFVVPADKFNSDEFLKFAKSKLFPHQVPKKIHCLEQLPETVTNKKDRATLVKHATTL